MPKCNRLSVTPVPPPEFATIDYLAKSLGLIDGLRAAETDCYSRCACCNGMYKDFMVWVPDTVRIGDSPESVTDVCRQNEYNGMHSAWCLACAKKLSKNNKTRTKAERETTNNTKVSDFIEAENYFSRIMKWIFSFPIK